MIEQASRILLSPRYNFERRAALFGARHIKRLKLIVCHLSQVS